MKRIFLLSAVVVGLAFAAAAPAQDLWIGDAAPALQGTKWFNGDPVDLTSAKDKKVLVVEFWATWCGPCISAMPHLTELQHKYADKDVIIIGVTKPDDNNQLEKVEKFVADNRAKMGYRVAFDGDEKTYESYMKAAGQTGIPTAFIVDKSGQVAWIGHPMNMDEPLAAVVAGTHDIGKAKLVKSLEKRAFDMKLKGDWDETIRAYEAVAVLDPSSTRPWYSLSRLYAYNLKWPGKTKEATTRALQIGHDNATFLASIAGFLVGRGEEYGCQKLALKAARRAVELDPELTAGHSALIRALAAVGNADDAKAHAAKTIDLLNDAAGLAQLANTLARPDVDFGELALKAAHRAVELDPESSSAGITLVRALAAAGKYDDAMAWARKTIDVLKDDAKSLARLADTLARPELEGRCGELALEAIEAAMAAEPDQARHVQTKFRILALCQKDLKAAEAIGRYALEKGGENAGFLNGFAWSLLTDDGLKGQFDELALAASQRCHELSEGENWMYLDTLALAKFEMGSKHEAFDLQTKAIEIATEKNVGGSSMTDLQAARERYQETDAHPADSENN